MNTKEPDAGNVADADVISCPHAVALDELAKAFGSDVERGLAPSQAAANLSRFGKNELAQAPPIPAWRRFLSQFTDLVVWILIVAAVVAGAVGEWTNTVAILAIVLLNGIIG